MYKELLNYNVMYQALEHLTVARTVHYLTYIFDCGTHEIIVGKETAAPVDLARDPQYASCLAARIEIWFWGGPPYEEDWHQGTLLTMLMDKLFYCVVMNFNDVIDKFLGTLHGGYYQTGSTKSKVAGCT